MRLIDCQIQGYKNIQNISLDFKKTKGRTLIVGTNGSGKSNLLEALSAIFSALYNKEEIVNPAFGFKLIYTLDEKDIVIVHNDNGHVEMQYKETAAESLCKIIDKKDYDKHLPDHVIAVYSGEEERLWRDYYFKSYDLYNKQYMDGKEKFHPQHMIYLNHYYWNLIASILSIHEIEDYRTYLADVIGIRNLSTIHMAFDVPKLNRNRNERAKQILEILNQDKKADVNVSLETYRQVRDLCGYETKFTFLIIP